VTGVAPAAGTVTPPRNLVTPPRNLRAGV